MSAIGAVTGNGIYSELEYQGSRFKVSQWYNDAMDAVSEKAFLKSARMIQFMQGTEKQIAQREVALARVFALGGFNFNSIVDDGGLDNDDDLLATFLFKLISPSDSTIRPELAAEMVKNDRPAVIKAVINANPLNGRLKTKTGPADQESPALSESGNDSGNHGKTSG